MHNTLSIIIKLAVSVDSLLLSFSAGYQDFPQFRICQFSICLSPSVGHFCWEYWLCVRLPFSLCGFVSPSWSSHLYLACKAQNFYLTLSDVMNYSYTPAHWIQRLDNTFPTDSYTGLTFVSTTCGSSSLLPFSLLTTPWGPSLSSPPSLIWGMCWPWWPFHLWPISAHTSVDMRRQTPYLSLQSY